MTFRTIAEGKIFLRGMHHNGALHDLAVLLLDIQSSLCDTTVSLTHKGNEMQSQTTSELYKMLSAARALYDEDLSAVELGSVINGSPATLKRYIAELRHMGCDIVSLRRPDATVYSLVNKFEVKDRLNRWLILERERSLLDTARPGLALARS